MAFDVSAFTTADAEHPPVPVAIDWEAVEGWLGVRLPDDYKELASGYGPLYFGDWIWIHVPCAEDGRFDYGEWLGSTHREARGKVQELPEDERPAVHPDPGGLLAWGYTRNTDVLFWDTSVSMDPNEWTVVVHHADGIPHEGLRRVHPFDPGLMRWHHYDLTLGEYLRHTVRAERELPSPPGPVIGPLPGTIARTAYLPDARPWTPPVPVPPRLTGAERRVALETGTGLDALRLLTPPPANPDLGGGTWEELFEDLGTSLPSEYVALMELYGAGYWSGWLQFYSPLRTGEKRYIHQIEKVMDGYRRLRDGWPETFPLAAWPEPGGFLPFAHNIDGDEIGWLTEGDDPDKWPLSIWPRHSDQGPPLEHGLIDAILELQRKIATARSFATVDEALESVTFKPFDDINFW
jgi:hypothetical protein